MEEWKIKKYLKYHLGHKIPIWKNDYGNKKYHLGHSHVRIRRRAQS